MNNFNKRIVFLFGLFSFIFVPSYLHAQNGRYNIDSIKTFIQKLSSDSEKVNTLLDLSRGIDCNDSSDKLIIATEAKRIAEKIKWTKGIINSNRFIGDIYFKCSKNYAKSFDYYERNVTFLGKTGDIPSMAKALETIAKQYEKIHRHQEAIEYYNRILELKPGVTIAATVYNNLGVLFKTIGNNKRALSFYDSSLTLLKSKNVKDLHDTFELAGLYMNLGDVYLITAQPDKALEYYKLVVKSGAPARDKQFLIWSLTGIGKTYKLNSNKSKNYDEAIKSYQEALKVCKDINAFEDEVKTEDELAKTYMETGDLVTALSYAETALSLAETQHYINLLSKCNATLGNIYIRQNKFDVAISYLQKAANIADQTSNLEDKLDAFDGLRVAYQKDGQFEKALDATTKYNAIKERLFNIETLNGITRDGLEKDFRNKRIVDSLSQAATYGKKIERQRVLTYSGFGAVVLVLLLAFFVYRNYKTQKKYNELLSREKTRHLAHIEAQSNVLSEISHIQAHQIRGPISTILGLVNIFNYDDPTDPINKQVMEWITSTTEKLDTVVKDIIIKENDLRGEHEDSEQFKS